MNESELARLIAQEVVKHLQTSQAAPSAQPRTLPAAVSARHIHVSPEDLETLFGSGHRLTKLKDLSQPGQFAAHETVAVIGPRGTFPKVRILGPARGRTQLEISITDGFALGVVPPVRFSGDVAGTPGVTIRGPRGEVTIQEGLIAAARHIHMHPTDARRFGVADKQLVKVRIGGPRALIFDQVLCRVSESFQLELHIDTDEANAACVKDGDLVELLI